VLGKIFGIVLLAISLKIITAQVATMKTTLLSTVEKIETNVQTIENLHREQVRHLRHLDSLQQRTDSLRTEIIPKP
jgi:2-iminoacetate synthase ThiH